MKLILKLIFPLYIVFLITVAHPQAGAEKEAGEQAVIENPSQPEISLKICKDVEDRMPVGSDTLFYASVGRVYCWSAIVGVQDSLKIYHVWNFEGEQQARVPIKVSSSYFRAFSFQSIDETYIGNWTVYVIDQDFNVLGKTDFRIKPEDEIAADSQ